MENCSICLQKVRNSKYLQVGIIWISFATVLIFYGALIPLLPVFVQSLAASGQKSTTKIIYNASDINRTNSQSYELSSVLTGTLVSLAQWTEVGANFFVGPLADKIGYDVPLFIGYLIVIGSSIGFAFADSYVTLVVWRAIQGVGAAFVVTSGTAVIADLFRHDDKQRGKMIAIVMCGLSIGLTIGPPFGSLLYLVGQKSAPFLAIAGMTFAISLLQFWVRTPKIHERQTNKPSGTIAAQLRLITDPYILMCALLIWIGYLGPAFLEGTLPLYMVAKLGDETWMTGTVFVPLNVAFAVFLPALAWLSIYFGRWPVAFFSYMFGALALTGYGFFNTFAAQLSLGLPLGLQLAGMDAIIFPLMAYLVDTRVREAMYGTAYALANIATSAAFGTGPILGGALVTVIGFNGSMFVVAGITLAGLIPLGLLRKPINAGRDTAEEENLLSEDSVKNGDSRSSSE